MKGRISKWLPCETGEARTWTLSPIGSLLRSRNSWGPQRPDLARPGLPVLVDEDPDRGQGADHGHGGKNHLGEDGPPALHQDLIAGPDRHLRGPALQTSKVQSHLRLPSVGAAAQEPHSV